MREPRSENRCSRASNPFYSSLCDSGISCQAVQFLHGFPYSSPKSACCINPLPDGGKPLFGNCKNGLACRCGKDQCCVHFVGVFYCNGVNPPRPGTATPSSKYVVHTVHPDLRVAITARRKGREREKRQQALRSILSSIRPSIVISSPSPSSSPFGIPFCSLPSSPSD